MKLFPQRNMEFGVTYISVPESQSLKMAPEDTILIRMRTSSLLLLLFCQAPLVAAKTRFQQGLGSVCLHVCEGCFYLLFQSFQLLMAHDRTINRIGRVCWISCHHKQRFVKKKVKRMTGAKRGHYPHNEQKSDESEHCWTFDAQNIQNLTLFFSIYFNS